MPVSRAAGWWMCLAALALASPAVAGPIADAGFTDDAKVVDSPRETVSAFLERCQAGHFRDAATLLQVPEQVAAPVAAQRLEAVLDRYVWFDLEHLSSAPGGNLGDGLPADEEDVGRFPLGEGRTAPVRLIREPGGWQFSESTVQAALTSYDQLGNRWLLDRLPDSLLRPGPRELLWWQWLALPFFAGLAIALGKLFGRLTQALLMRIARRTEAKWDDDLVPRLSGPLALGWSVIAAYGLLPYFGLDPPAEAMVTRSLEAIGFVSIFWVLLRMVDVGGQVAGQALRARGNLTLGPLITLGVRSAKLVVVALAVVAVLSQLGYPVASLIAGLGVGGLALALAAQKTVENLFGAFSLAVDQPIREGDFVKVEDFVGTVEAIGLRSTRIRTLDRTVVSIPNGKLAEMRLESYTVRDRLRLFVTLGLVYETTAAQMREALAGIEKVLASHPKAVPGFTVRFAGLGESSLNVEVFTYLDTTDWNTFTTYRQDLLLQFMDVVEKAGSGFAFPSRTLYLAQEGSAPVGGPSKA